MTREDSTPALGTCAADTAATRRWIALGVLALVQFMLSIDSTVVNIALPSIQRDLGFSGPGLAWVVNGYSLVAGGFLLLAGRVADHASRKRLFAAGVALFALASLACGLAPNPAVLVGARFAQGLGVAIVSPAALSLAVLMFPLARERARALAIWGGLAGAGGTFGVVIGGVVTSALSWRWIFLVNLPVAAVVLLATPRLVPEARGDRTGRLDPVSAVLITAGLTLLVDGLLAAADRPWGSAPVLWPLAGGGAVLICFVGRQAVVRDPLIPLRFLRDRTRATANIATVLGMASFMTMFFILTLYLQEVGHYPPLASGLAYLPFGVAMLTGIAVSTRVLPRINLRLGLIAGFGCAAAAMLLLGQVGEHIRFAADVLPATILYGFAQGLLFPALRVAALHRAAPAETGLASGIQNTTLQVGGSLGLAVLVSAALRHAGGLIGAGQDSLSATVDGYRLAFRIGAAVLAAGAVLIAVGFEHSTAAAKPAAPVENGEQSA